MESAHERKSSTPSSSPLPSSSDSPKAAPKNTTGLRKHDQDNNSLGKPNSVSNQTPKAAGDNTSTDKGLGPKSPGASTNSSLLDLDLGNGLGNLESDHGKGTATSLGVDSQLTASYIDDDFLPSPGDKNEQSRLSTSDSPPTQSPPTQVMERSGEPSTTPYRIPDYVFARKPSSTPMEWSTASNESLFSIQMGNMSFTRDQFSFIGKSGELGLPGEINIAGIDFSSNHPPDKQAEISQNGGNLNEGSCLKATEAKAVETMREVLRESAENDNKETPSSHGENHSKEKPSSTVQNRSKGTPPQLDNLNKENPVKNHKKDSSFHSDNLSKGLPSPKIELHKVSPSLVDHNESTRSFAFPILAGDGGDKSGSLRPDGLGRHKQHSPQKPRSPQVSQQQTPPKESSTPNAPSQAPKSTLAAMRHRWLACFSCCPFCN